MMFSSPGDAASVLTLTLFVALGLYALCGLLRPERAFDRFLFGTLTAALIATYARWRWNDTLPPLAPELGALWPRLFFAAEIVAVVYTLMSVVILLRFKDRSAEADAAQARHEAGGDWPAVDIFICTYNEPRDVVEKSILPALAIDYGPKTVWVCDDTRRDWLRAYCAEVGAHYITRPDNTGAKAGNLNNALRHTAARTNAPLILVLDADFAPQPDILKRMVGLFDDPKAAVVQSPQFSTTSPPPTAGSTTSGSSSTCSSPPRTPGAPRSASAPRSSSGATGWARSADSRTRPSARTLTCRSAWRGGATRPIG